MRIDASAFIGAYPYRDIGTWDATQLLKEMDRVKIDAAWLSHLSAIFRPDPASGNAELYAATSSPRLHAVPAVHPGVATWQATIDDAAKHKVPAIRCDVTRYSLDPTGREMRSLLAAAAERDLPVMMAVRLEDGRQRDPSDTSTDIAPWMLRAMIRSHPRVRLIVTHADRDTVEQVHFGATPDEAARLLWDITWIWGPPEEHLATLLHTVGVERFAFGTGNPLRIPDSSIAKLDLLDLDAKSRRAIEAENLLGFQSR